MSKKRKKITLTKKATKIIRCGNLKCSNKIVVDVSAVSGLCWKCVQDMVPSTLPMKKPKSDKPVGWKFMSVFVDKNGVVYHKGVEQPKLKGTLPITDVEKIRKDQKKKRLENKKKKEKNKIKKEKQLVETYKKKKEILKKEKLNNKKNKDNTIEPKTIVKSKARVKLKTAVKPKTAVKSRVKVKPKTRVKPKTAVKSKVKLKSKKTELKDKRNYNKIPKITQSVINKMIRMYKKENYRITSNMIDRLGYDKYRIKVTLKSVGVYGQKNR